MGKVVVVGSFVELTSKHPCLFTIYSTWTECRTEKKGTRGKRVRRKVPTDVKRVNTREILFSFTLERECCLYIGLGSFTSRFVF